MHRLLHLEEPDGPAAVSTGHLPGPDAVAALVQAAWQRYRLITEGKVADYIPALAGASPEWFGICVVGVSGTVHAAGDTDRLFSIQSISKPFVFALVCQALGGQRARESIGVNATGLPFNSVMAIELNAERTMNPMVNAGAIATTSLTRGANPEAKWRFLREGLSRFAGRGVRAPGRGWDQRGVPMLRHASQTAVPCGAGPIPSSICASR